MRLGIGSVRNARGTGCGCHRESDTERNENAAAWSRVATLAR